MYFRKSSLVFMSLFQIIISGIEDDMYGIMTEERVICEIRIDKAAGRGDSDSRMTCFEVIMSLKLQSTKILIYSV